MPRLASLALAFGLGVLIACHDGTAGRAAVLLWSSALVTLVLALRVRGRWLLVVAALLGATRMSIHELRSPVVLPPGASVDDRETDVLRGVVRGPVEDGGDHHRFVLHVDPPGDVRVLVSAPAPAEVLPGDRVSITGRLRTPRGYRVPGGVDAQRMTRARGADLMMYARHVEVMEAGARWSAWRLATWAQRQASARIASRGGDAAGNGVVRAMVTGDRAGLDQAVVQRFRDAGVSHVLAVSGLHLAVVALLLFTAVRHLWAALPALATRVEPALAAALVAAPGALAYTLITGARISTTRALLVVAVVLCGAAMARRAALIDALGVAALVVLMHRPIVIFEPSFQLSFAATATLALAFRRDDDVRRPARGVATRAARRLWSLVRASLWASLATAPFTALAFASVATGGPLANLIAVPLTELVIVPIGLGGSVIAALWPAGGGLLLDLVIAAAGWMDVVVAWVARVAPVLSVYPPGGWELAGAALIWTGAILAARGACRQRVALAVIAAGLSVVFGSLWASTRWAPAAQKDVRVTFLDVGQGDAAVVELPGGAVWMIDGGGLPFVAGAASEAERAERAQAPGRHAVARFLAWRRIGRIDLLVISHPHPDHFEGLHALVGSVPVSEVWVAADYEQVPPSYQALLDALVAAGARVVHPRLGQAHVERGVALTALAPLYDDVVVTADPVDDANDNSLVVRLDAFGRSILFAGDVEREGEALLVERHGHALRVDLVKVPHHGSRTSSTPAFVAATSPAWAIISCGVANRFGFPAPEVVERWQRVGAQVLRTDRAGAVTVTLSPGGHLRVQSVDGP